MNKCNTKKPGRLIGTTNDKKRKDKELLDEIKYKITCRFVAEVLSVNPIPHYKQDIFNRIVIEEMNLYGITNKFIFPYSTMRSRIKRNSLNAKGTESPICSIESKLVQLILCMNKIKRSMTVSEGLMLANDLIRGTDTEQKLVQWKQQQKFTTTQEQI